MLLPLTRGSAARVAALMLGLVMTACTGEGSASEAASAAPGSEPPRASASVSPAESTEAPASATGEGALCAVGHETCPLEAGTYTAAPFEPNFAFTIDDGWTNDRAFADGGGISQESGGIYWASGVEAGRIGEEDIEIGASTDDFVIFLRGFEAVGMSVSEPTPITVDGVSGQQVDVESNEAEAPGLYQIAEDSFNLVPGEKARFLVLDKGGETVILIIDAFASDDFDDWVETAQPVLDSISWK